MIPFAGGTVLTTIFLLVSYVISRIWQKMMPSALQLCDMISLVLKNLKLIGQYPYAQHRIRKIMNSSLVS